MSADTLFDLPQMEMVKSPRDFSLLEIPAKIACGLNGRWHSRFPLIQWGNVVRNKRSLCFALIYKEQPYGVAIWSSPIAANRLKDGRKLLELRRMALSEYCPKNTASWMLAKMERDIKRRFPEIIKLISYQDTEAHIGTIYKASNWLLADGKGSNVSWTTIKRERNQEQSIALKVRWEKMI